jgi:hypothetical protein
MQNQPPTDEELTVAVEKIVAAIHDLLTFVRGFSDEQWEEFRNAEDRRRCGEPPAWPIVYPS